MNEAVINKTGNKHCVLCAGKNPSWGCLPFAVLVCTKCAGGMRELGTGICTVKSLLLDSVDEKFLAPFTSGSNSLFLDWYAEHSKEDLSPSFFKSALAKEYVSLLKQGKIKEKAMTSAPVISPSAGYKLNSSRSQKKSKLKLVSATDECTEEKEEPELEEREIEREVNRRKTTIKRVPGKILTDDSSAKGRLGMFKNIKEVQSESVELPDKSALRHSSERNTRVLTGDIDRPSLETEVVRGKNFIGSASTPKETVSDKIKKSLEKGKKTLLNTFKK